MDEGDVAVGIVGDAPASLPAAVSEAGGVIREGDVESVLEERPDAVVAVGERAALECARAASDVPILPVDAGRGLRSVPADALPAAAERLVDGEFDTETHPVLSVAVAERTVGRAVADVTLITAEAARISEFAVTADREHVGQFRADGVVVATPAGTPGYARQVGSPITAPGTGVAAVAPIAPFATNPDHWVVALEDVRLTVERDEAAVTLLGDDVSLATLGKGEAVRLTHAGTATVAVLAESRPRFP